MGLHTSWTKTKLQNVSCGSAPSAAHIQGHVVEVTERFTYLGSDIDSSGRSMPEVIRRIGLAASILGRLTNVWRQQRLSLATKLRLYNTLMVSVLLHGAETWTLLQSDEQKLEAFHMTCQHRILGVRWYNFVQNTVIAERTGLDSLLSSIRRRRSSDMSTGFPKPLQLPSLWNLLLMYGRVARWMTMATARNGDDLAGGHDTPGCKNLRLTLDSPPTTYGTLPVTVMLGGSYDPSPVKRISEWMSDH